MAKNTQSKMVSEKKVSSTKRVEKKFNKEEASQFRLAWSETTQLPKSTRKMFNDGFVTDSIHIRKDRYAYSTSVLNAQYWVNFAKWLHTVRACVTDICNLSDNRNMRDSPLLCGGTWQILVNTQISVFLDLALANLSHWLGFPGTDVDSCPDWSW